MWWCMEDAAWMCERRESAAARVEQIIARSNAGVSEEQSIGGRAKQHSYTSLGAGSMAQASHGPFSKGAPAQEEHPSCALDAVVDRDSRAGRGRAGGRYTTVSFVAFEHTFIKMILAIHWPTSTSIEGWH